MEKITISQNFENIVNKLRKGVIPTEAEIAFLEERKAQHEKKVTNRKPTKSQLANKELAESLLSFMASNPNRLYTVSDLMKSAPCFANYEGDLTHSKANAIVKILKDANLVERSEDKGKAYFKYRA